MQVVSPLTISAPALYALSQGERCEGPTECHWCGAPTEKLITHDEPPPTPFLRRTTTAKKPGNQFICRGCFLWKRARLTVPFTDGTLKDSQTPSQWSWFITNSEAISPKIGRMEIYHRLLKPPARFALLLVDDPKTNNLIHLAEVNDYTDKDLLNDSPLRFTLNNIRLEYTIYDLEHALKNGPTGTSPGVAALIRLFGRPEKDESEEEKVKRGSGRPSTKGDRKPGQVV